MNELDWRLKVFTTVAKDTVLPWNGHQVNKGDTVKLVSQVKLNSKKSLTIPVPSLTALYIDHAVKSWEQYWNIRQEQKINSSIKSEVTFKSDAAAFDAIALIASSTISAYTAVEAFCNDSIPENHEYWHNRKSEIILEKSDKFALERHFTTGSKLKDVLPGIYGVESPEGKNPVWMSYGTLKKVRDGLIHAKSKDTRSTGLDKKNLWDHIFAMKKPYLLAKDIFDWYLKNKEQVPVWYTRYPK